MNRRQFLISATIITASGSTLAQALEMSFHPRLGEPAADVGVPAVRPLRIGLVGVVGQGVNHLHDVACRLPFDCRRVAIDTNKARLDCSRADSRVFLSHDGNRFTTPRDAQVFGRERRRDIATALSDFDVVLLLSGLNGIAGFGITAVVGEILAESGVYTVAIAPRRLDGDGSACLHGFSNVTFEVLDDHLMHKARIDRKSGWFHHYYMELVPEVVAQISTTAVAIIKERDGAMNALRVGSPVADGQAISTAIVRACQRSRTLCDIRVSKS